MKYKIFILALILSIAVSACGRKSSVEQTTINLPETEIDIQGPALIKGSFTYTNDFVLENYYIEHAVMLTDMTSFILRDLKWELPVDSQVLGYVDVDEDANSARYRLSLPVLPEGEMQDVDQDGRKDRGVQVFAVAYSPNLTGDVFSVGDDRSMGWPSYLASVLTDTENHDEVVGGKLIIWSPDAEQQFPSGFGKDGLLFTKDDPMMDVPVGYSVISLDKNPFTISREEVETIDLYEPKDVAVKDYSHQSYSEAFQTMYDTISVEYAFNGIEGKEPDWQALYAKVMPMVKQAEEEENPYAFFLALHEFTLGFNDGHVYFDGNEHYWNYLYENVFPGYGFSAKESDDGKVIVVYVTADSLAEEAGLQKGAQILSVNDMPVSKWIANTKLFFPTSSPHLYRYDQVTAAFRAPIGQRMTIKYRSQDGKIDQLTLTSFYDPYSFIAVDSAWASYYSSLMPVEYKLISDDIGYVRINSNSDDIGLIIRLFGHALQAFSDNGASNLIIDMRVNSGGTNLGLAGFLYDQNIPIGQLEYYSEKTGKFEPEGIMDEVYPNEEQYRFDQIILLVDQYCASACELEAYGFSQVPGVIVMGENPTAGMEAEVARGEFVLPEDITLTIPTGRFVKPDGSLLIEGVGVVPTVKLPTTVESLLSEEDIALNAAVEYLNTHQ